MVPSPTSKVEVLRFPRPTMCDRPQPAAWAGLQSSLGVPGKRTQLADKKVAQR